MKNRRGQSTVEYVLLVTAVLTVIIAFVANKNSAFQTQLTNGLCAAVQDMNSLAGTLSDSHQPNGQIQGGTPSQYSVNVSL